jgi:hypothetical protein
MSDLRSIMTEAVSSGPARTAPVVVDADLARGRKALRRHRLTRVGAGSGLALTAAAVSAFLIVSPLSSSTPDKAPAAPAAAAATSDSSGSSLKGFSLVAYTGKQPPGYTLDRLPEGWKVFSSDGGALTLAPKTLKEKPAPDGVVVFDNKVAVSQEHSVPSGVDKDEVTVDGHPAVIAHMLGRGSKPDGTLTLFLKQRADVYLSIQVAPEIGWNNEQIAQFAGGVHITDDAVVSVG